MGFFLQIIYLNKFVLKLFIPWVCFFTTMRLLQGRVLRKDDTWHDLRHVLHTDAIGCAAASGALDRVGTQAHPAGLWSPQSNSKLLLPPKKTIQSMSLFIFFLSILNIIYVINTFNLN